MRISDWSSDVCSSDLDLRVEAGVDRARGVAPRQRVGGVGVAAATEAVARELVEQQEQRQRAVGAVHPGFQLAPGGGPVGVDELCTEARVEGVVAREPFAGAGVAQEGEDGEGGGGGG